MSEKILIIDDDLETLRLVGLLLQRQGYDILSAQNGADGLKLANIDPPDLIVLDLMMPNMDGYQVAKRLKASPQTSEIPILVFTAKSQSEDKIAGIEAGADDYLTKPVRPVELVAHIRALVPRSDVSLPIDMEKRGRIIGFLAAKGGLGVSTLALNLGILLEQRSHIDTIAVELRPGQGTWAGELGFANPTGLINLLKLPAKEITSKTTANELVKTSFGIQLLLASTGIQDFEILNNAETQIEALIDALAEISQILILDIGTPFYPTLDRILEQCDELCVVSEPQPYCLHRTSQLIDELGRFGYGVDKTIHTIVVNRVRADLQLGAVQIQEMLGRPIHLVVPPVPELAYHSAMRNLPLSIIQPEGIYSQQLLRLAAKIAEPQKI